MRKLIMYKINKYKSVPQAGSWSYTDPAASRCVLPSNLTQRGHLVFGLVGPRTWTRETGMGLVHCVKGGDA